MSRFNPTPTQIANLHILADFLDSDRVSENRFNIKAYYSEDGGELDLCFVGDMLIDVHCGTAACALGWAPTALGVDPEYDEDHVNSWSLRHLGTSDTSLPEGQFMFGYDAPDGASKAAERIRFTIEHFGSSSRNLSWGEVDALWKLQAEGSLNWSGLTKVLGLRSTLHPDGAMAHEYTTRDRADQNSHLLCCPG